jgi:hypothetical protein
MYKYEFIKVKLKGILKYSPKNDYHEIIRSYANEGWRLIQIFSPPIIGNGRAEYFELIFKKT